MLDLFEDRLAVFMFELVSSVKHGNIHKCSVAVMSNEFHFLDHATNKRAKFLGAGKSNSMSRLLSAIVRPLGLLVIFTVTPGRNDPSQSSKSR